MTTEERQALADMFTRANDWISNKELEAALDYLESLGWPTPDELTLEQAAEFKRVQADAWQARE